jgi:hypothetical protein
MLCCCRRKKLIQFKSQALKRPAFLIMHAFNLRRIKSLTSPFAEGARGRELGARIRGILRERHLAMSSERLIETL